jgi:hypothetical protein
MTDLRIYSQESQKFPEGRLFKAISIANGNVLILSIGQKNCRVQASMVEEICDILDDMIFIPNQEIVSKSLWTEPSEDYPAGMKICFTLLPRNKTFGIKFLGQTAVFNFEQLEEIAAAFDLFVLSHESLVAA